MNNVLACRNERALYKMVCDTASNRVVGLHMIGPESGEIIQAAAVAVRAGLTKEAFDQTLALNWTLSEWGVVSAQSRVARPNKKPKASVISPDKRDNASFLS